MAVETVGGANVDSMTKNARVVDVVMMKPTQLYTETINELKADLAPIVGYAEEPLLPLAEASAPLIDIIHDLLTYVQMALDETPPQPPDGLTIDESAAIRLYTIEWNKPHRSLYSMLNHTLKKADREDLRPYFKYMKLLLTALVKLPCLPQLTTWRGVTKNISAEFSPGTTVTWWAFSSCTTALPVLENNMYLGNAGDRTLFSVEAINGRSVRAHSHFATEDEILLLPGTHMVVQSQFCPAPNLHVIHLKQVTPTEVLLEPPFEGACLYPTIERPWYRKKRIITPICLLTTIIIGAIILGSVLGTRSNSNPTASVCHAVNCSTNGGGGTCAAFFLGATNYTCTGCTYGLSVTNGPCPQNPCVLVNCSSQGGGGNCIASGGGTTNYTCTSCTYGSNVTNGPCPQDPCILANCNSQGGGGNCIASGDGTTNYMCTSCIAGSNVPNGPCPSSRCTCYNATAYGGHGGDSGVGVCHTFGCSVGNNTHCSVYYFLYYYAVFNDGNGDVDASGCACPGYYTDGAGTNGGSYFYYYLDSFYGPNLNGIAPSCADFGNSSRALTDDTAATSCCNFCCGISS